LRHVWPGKQVVHVPPLVPQVEADCAWQMPLASQQPLGQLVLLHTQVPLTQAWPAEQLLPQEPQLLRSLWVLVQVAVVPVPQQFGVAPEHAALAPHWHWPLTH
jgi:hypothetical protein